MKNSILHQIYARHEKNVIKKNCSLEKDLKINFRLFFHKNYIFSFVHQKRFYENQKFPPKYTRYVKHVRKQNCLFQKDLQLWSQT